MFRASNFDEEDSMVEANKAVIQRWYEEVWNQGRSEAIAEMLAEDCIVNGLADEKGETIQGFEGFKRFHEIFRSAFPDLTIRVEHLIAEGDYVVAHCVASGCHSGEGLGVAASKKPFEITGVSISRMKDGKIAEAWNNFDFLTLYKQIGLL
jgi:steroid delta-isomerase-like uncharacterized protein